MAENDNGQIIETPVLSAPIPGRNAVVYAGLRPDFDLYVDDPLALSQSLPEAEATIVDGVPKKTPAVVERDSGYLAEGATVGWETWFESFHIIPRFFDFEDVLSAESATIEVYSAFRRVSHDWDTFTNNAGAGVTLVGEPSLPHTFVPQSNGALTMSVDVSPSGAPVVDTTLDFVFDVPQTILVPIELSRVVLFSIQPELPFTEKLQWLTEVEPHIDGTEQRLSARKNPRQIFLWDFIMEDGAERAFFQNVIFDWQSQIFGLPIWHELTRLSTAVAVNDLTITVQSTAYADYRVGGLVLVFTDKDTFDVLELASLTATTLTFTSGSLNVYPVGTFVMPARTGVAKQTIQGSRFVSGVAKIRIEFRVKDNDANLADTSAFGTYKGKVLIDGCNNVRGQMSEAFLREIVVMDSEAGITEQTSPWDRSKRITQLALLTKGQQDLWEHRQMLHALRGKQISWYLVTFSKDLIIDSDIAAGSSINVENVGYTQFVKSRQPWNVIRIVYNDGSPDDLREVLSSVEVDSTRETLTIDSALGAHLQGTVSRIMFVEKVRWDSDEINIRHEVGDRVKRITGPVKTVFE